MAFGFQSEDADTLLVPIPVVQPRAAPTTPVTPAPPPSPGLHLVKSSRQVHHGRAAGLLSRRDNIQRTGPRSFQGEPTGLGTEEACPAGRVG